MEQCCSFKRIFWGTCLDDARADTTLCNTKHHAHVNCTRCILYLPFELPRALVYPFAPTALMCLFSLERWAELHCAV